MDESQNNTEERNQTQEITVYSPIYESLKDESNFCNDRKQTINCLEPKWKGAFPLGTGTEYFKVMIMFCMLIMAMVTWVYKWIYIIITMYYLTWMRSFYCVSINYF